MHKTIANIFIVLAAATLAGCRDGRTSTPSAATNPIGSDGPTVTIFPPRPPETIERTDSAPLLPPKVADVHSLGVESLVGNVLTGKVRNDGTALAKGVTVIVSAVDRKGSTFNTTARVDPADLQPGAMGTFNVKQEGLVDPIISIDAVQWETKDEDARAQGAYIEAIRAQAARTPEGQIAENYEMNGMSYPPAPLRRAPSRMELPERLRTGVVLAAPATREVRSERMSGHSCTKGSACRKHRGSPAPSGYPVYAAPDRGARVVKYLDRPTYGVIRTAGSWHYVRFRDPRNPRDLNYHYGWVSTAS